MFRIQSKAGGLVLKHRFGKVYTVEAHRGRCSGVIYDPLNSSDLEYCFQCGRKFSDTSFGAPAIKRPKTEESFFELYDTMVNLTNGVAATIPFDVLLDNKDEYESLRSTGMTLTGIIQKIAAQRQKIFTDATLERGPESKVKEILKEEADFLFTRKFQSNSTPPEGLVIRSSGTQYGPEDKGVYALYDLQKETPLGYFGGLVMQSPEIKEGKLTQFYIIRYVLEMEIYGSLFSYGFLDIDPTRRHVPVNYNSNSNISRQVEDYMAWNGIMNHKPDFSRMMEVKGNYHMPEAWRHIFCNVKVDPHMQVKLKRDIEAGEELTWDYGPGYWSTSENPVWDLSKAPKSFFDFVIEGKIPDAWIQENAVSSKIGEYGRDRLDSEKIRENIIDTLGECNLIGLSDDMREAIDGLFED